MANIWVALLVAAVGALGTILAVVFMAGRMVGAILYRLDDTDRRIEQRHRENSERMGSLETRLERIDRALERRISRS